MNPLISIIIPSYNREHLIAETLQSIMAQTYTNWECIIVDDHSTDNTFAVAEEFQKQDKRFQIYLKPDDRPKGPGASRNFGLSLAKGSFINWLDSDDLLDESKLETDLNHIQSGNYDFTISQSEFFRNSIKDKIGYWNENLYSEDAINDFILKRIGWSISACIWSKQILQENRVLFDEYLITADDYFFHVNALEYGLKPKIIHETLSYIRVHENRLNEFKGKAKFKCYVYRYLIEHKETLKLTQHTEQFISNNFLNQLSALYLQKEFKLGINYSRFLWNDASNHIPKSTLVKMAWHGLIYITSGKGFRLLKQYQVYEG